MIARPIVRQLARIINDMGGVVVNSTMGDQSAEALIGGTFFGIEVRIDRSDESEDEDVRKVVEAAGGKWIVLETQYADMGAAIRQGVHYSTAKTADNIDASIQHWCEHFSLELTNEQAEMLAHFMKPGAPSC